MCKKYRLELLLIVAIACTAQAQPLNWQSLNGPFGGSLSDLVVTSESGWAFVTWNGGVYRSTDRGQSWERASAGIMADAQSVELGMLGYLVSSITLHEPSGTLLLGAGAGIFRSFDRGSSWHLDSSSSTIPRNTIIAVGIDSVILGSDYEGVVVSRDCGRTWDSIFGRGGSTISVAVDSSRRA